MVVSKGFGCVIGRWLAVGQHHYVDRPIGLQKQCVDVAEADEVR